MGNQFKNAAVILCLKTFLFIFNVVLWVIGVALFCTGIWAEFDLYRYSILETSPEFSGTAPLVVIGVAAVTVAVSSVAFSCILKGQPVLLITMSPEFSCTAPLVLIGVAAVTVGVNSVAFSCIIKEQTVLLITYGGYLACITVLDLGLGAAVACYRGSFGKALYDGLITTLASHDDDSPHLDIVQSTLHCCGVKNYTDWTHLSPNRVVPLSCCQNSNSCVTANYGDLFQRGCYDVIREYLTDNLDFLMCLAVGVALLPLVGTVLSCVLAYYIKKIRYDAIE